MPKPGRAPRRRRRRRRRQCGAPRSPARVFWDCLRACFEDPPPPPCSAPVCATRNVPPVAISRCTGGPIGGAARDEPHCAAAKREKEAGGAKIKLRPGALRCPARPVFTRPTALSECTSTAECTPGVTRPRGPRSAARSMPAPLPLSLGFVTESFGARGACRQASPSSRGAVQCRPVPPPACPGHGSHSIKHHCCVRGQVRTRQGEGGHGSTTRRARAHT